MMHFAATGVSLLALIFAAVGAFTNFMVVSNKDDKKPLVWYDGSRLCIDNDGTVTCTVYPELKKDYDKADEKWEGSIPHNMELAGHQAGISNKLNAGISHGIQHTQGYCSSTGRRGEAPKLRQNEFDAPHQK